MSLLASLEYGEQDRSPIYTVLAVCLGLLVGYLLGTSSILLVHGVVSSFLFLGFTLLAVGGLVLVFAVLDVKSCLAFVGALLIGVGIGVLTESTLFLKYY